MPFGIDDALTIGGGLLGSLGGLFGGGSGNQSQRQSTNQSTNWNQTQTNSPWAGIQPYLTGMPVGESGPAGLYPEAARLYGASGWTPQMQELSADWFGNTTNNRDLFRGAGNIGQQMLAGSFDPHITAAGPITNPFTIGPAPTDLSRARAAQGDGLDPSKALQGFLTGEATNPWVEKQGTAITDALTRNMKENIFPGIRHNAIADGQYGGSRGDMAEALAISRLNTDLAPALAQLGGTAYENEQQRKYGVATGLNDQAVGAQQADLNRKMAADQVNARNLLDVQKFNSGTTLSNNAQIMQAMAQVVGNRGAGLNFASGAQGLTDQTYTDLLKALGLPTDYQWDNLDRYNAIVSPAAQFQTTDGAGTSNSSGTGTSTSNTSGVTIGFRPTTSRGLFGLLGP